MQKKSAAVRTTTWVQTFPDLIICNSRLCPIQKNVDIFKNRFFQIKIYIFVKEKISEYLGMFHLLK
jgi:hypothetical protein